MNISHIPKMFVFYLDFVCNLYFQIKSSMAKGKKELWTLRVYKLSSAQSMNSFIIKVPLSEAASKRNVPTVDCETEIKKYLSYTADRLSRKRAREQAGERQILYEWAHRTIFFKIQMSS